MDHAKFCFKAVFKPYFLQWKYSWDQNIKFIFYSSVISQLPRFLFSVCSAYSLSSNALEATRGFIDSWLIIPLSQLNFDGPRLAVHKDPPQCAFTSQTAMLSCEFSKHNCGKCTLRLQQNESILKSLAEVRFKWRATHQKEHFKNLRMPVHGKSWHASSPSLFSKEFKLGLAPAFESEFIVVHGRPSTRVSLTFCTSAQLVEGTDSIKG